MGYITTVLTPAERAQGRAEERRAGDRDGRARSARRRQRACRLGAAGAGASDGAGAGRGRRVRPRARRHPGRHRDGHGEGRLVDRVRQLLQPFCRRGRGHRASRRRAPCATGWRASPPAQLNVPMSRTSRLPAGASARARNPDNAVSFARVAGAQPLGAGRAARRHRTRRSAKPCSGRRRNWPRRTKPTRSTRRCATASSSISAAWRSIEPPAANADRPLRHHARLRDDPASRAWSTGRSAADLRRRVGAALYEEYAYGPGRQLPVGHASPTICCPPRWRCRIRSSCTARRRRRSRRSAPKGVGEGNCMSTPVCIANAVADALGVDGHRPAADARRSCAQIVRGAEPRAAGRRVQPRRPEAQRPQSARRGRGDGRRAARAGLGHAARPRGASRRCIPGCHKRAKARRTRISVPRSRSGSGR